MEKTNHDFLSLKDFLQGHKLIPWTKYILSSNECREFFSYNENLKDFSHSTR